MPNRKKVKKAILDMYFSGIEEYFAELMKQVDEEKIERIEFQCLEQDIKSFINDLKIKTKK